jgi:O-antigen/teichoic acid export membrane protein
MMSIILAPELITLFLGEKWLNSVVIFQILAVWAMLRSIGNPVGSLIMALGKPKLEMQWNLLMMFYMPIMVYISSSWGIEGIAWGNLISMFLLFIPGWYFLIYKISGIKLVEYITSFLNILVVIVLLGLVLKYGKDSLHLNYMFIILISVVSLILIYKVVNNKFYVMLKSLLNARSSF